MSTNSKPATLGEYIRQERERSGLSIRQLATQVGMHHSRLARLERGEVGDRTTPEYIQGIADTLGVDVTKLLRFSGVTPKPELPAIKTYFRRKLGVDADEAEVLAQLVANHQASKKRNPKGGTMSQPLNTDNQALKSVTKTTMEGLLLQLRALAPNRPLSYGESLALARLQAKTLREWAKAARPDMNLVWLLNQRVVPVSLVASHRLGEESGMTTNAVTGRLEVFLNAAEPAKRQRFSLLHEFKHVIDFLDADRLHARLGNGNRQVQADQIELICNEFAAHVLMPRRIVVTAWQRTRNVQLLAELFNVSAEAMSTRLAKLGLLDQQRSRPRSYFRLSTHWPRPDEISEVIAA